MLRVSSTLARLLALQPIAPFHRQRPRARTRPGPVVQQRRSRDGREDRHRDQDFSAPIGRLGALRLYDGRRRGRSLRLGGRSRPSPRGRRSCIGIRRESEPNIHDLIRASRSATRGGRCAGQRSSLVIVLPPIDRFHRFSTSSPIVGASGRPSRVRHGTANQNQRQEGTPTVGRHGNGSKPPPATNKAIIVAAKICESIQRIGKTNRIRDAAYVNFPDRCSCAPRDLRRAVSGACGARASDRRRSCRDRRRA